MTKTTEARPARKSKHKIASTLIICLGTPLSGDERAGLDIAEALKKTGLPEGVEVFEAAAGCDLTEVFAWRREVIVIDTVNVPGTAGNIVELSPEDFLADCNADLLAHADVRKPLALTHVMDRAPKRFKVFGIIPSDANREQELSEEVRRQIPAVVQAVMEEIRNNHF